MLMSVMTSTMSLRSAPATCGDLDPFVAPLPSHRIVDAPVRSRVVLEGFVVETAVAWWVGGPVLEVKVSDGTGEIVLAFFGRRGIGGIEPARVLTAAGTVGLHRGRPTVLNPIYWLHSSVPEPADA